MYIRQRKELPLLLKYFNLPLIAAEIGVAGASNASDLLKNGIEKLYCIDSWMGDEFDSQQLQDDNYNLAVKLLSQFDSSRYVILKGLSSKMYEQIPDNSLGLVYLDGSHDYDFVKADLENYYPKLVDGGIIGAHDYVNISAVMQAVNEFADLHELKVYIIPETSRGDAGCWMQI